MAQRRMFTLKIVDSDAFLDMGQGAQLLYFHLSMRADDDGFIGNPKKIMRVIGSSEDDMKILLAKRFLILFESGIIVVKHWRMHNYIQNDRHTATQYVEEKKRLTVKENGSYTECIQNVDKMDTQVRLGKDRIGENTQSGVPDDAFDTFWKMYPRKEAKKKALLKWQKISEKDKMSILEDIPKRLKTDAWQRGFAPHAITYLNGERWNDELTSAPTRGNTPSVHEI